jgi:Tfp pilus assembly protein PilF
VQAATEALEIDDRLADARNSLAMVRAVFHWDHEGAQQEFQRALGLDPSYATLHHWHSLFRLAPAKEFVR